MLRLDDVRRVLAYSEPVDMRKSFDGLLALTTQVLKEDPLSGTLFVFSNRRGNFVKVLAWDRTGFCLFAKRLERGRFLYRSGELSAQELRLLLDGIPIRARQGARNLVNAHA